MKYSPKQYAQALYETLHDTKPEYQDLVVDNFAAVLKEHGDLEKFAEIEEAFLEYEKTAKGIKVAEVTAARKLGAAAEEKIVRELNRYLDAEVELKARVDAGLLGGIVVRVDDTLIDGSVKRNLADLKTNLSR